MQQAVLSKKIANFATNILERLIKSHRPLKNVSQSAKINIFATE